MDRFEQEDDGPGPPTFNAKSHEARLLNSLYEGNSVRKVSVSFLPLIPGLTAYIQAYL